MSGGGVNPPTSGLATAFQVAQMHRGGHRAVWPECAEDVWSGISSEKQNRAPECRVRNGGKDLMPTIEADRGVYANRVRQGCLRNAKLVLHRARVEVSQDGRDGCRHVERVVHGLAENQHIDNMFDVVVRATRRLERDLRTSAAAHRRSRLRRGLRRGRFRETFGGQKRVRAGIETSRLSQGDGGALCAVADEECRDDEKVHFFFNDFNDFL